MRTSFSGPLKRQHVILALVLICVLFYTEFFIYHINTRKWLRLKCTNPKFCTKILLVADPQIIGNVNEVVHFITPLSIWDSDRYLRVTYQRVFSYVKPDIVIFLGDLFDEGSVSTQKEFEGYVERLSDIFKNHELQAEYIWLPGDNDIGGEGGDFVTANKVEKFNKAFPQSDRVQNKNIIFYRLNKIVHYIPNVKDNNDISNENFIRIGLSHIPILTSYATFTHQVIGKLAPHLLFTAHEHKSKIIHLNAQSMSERQIDVTDPKVPKKHRYTLSSEDIYEFVVPTCSYRMGTKNIGYGYATIEGKEVQYTVLWSPTRFPSLLIYGFILAVLLPLILIASCGKLCRMYMRMIKFCT